MTDFITPDIEEYVRQKVSSGLYSSSRDVLRAAIRALDEKEWRDYERREVRKGLKQADRGELSELDMDGIIAEARAGWQQSD